MFTSENGHFASSRKNIYEEALHKCEEERYDFDLNIEANLHAIKLLEPIAKQIINMNSDEKSRFKLPEGVVPGASKSIYQRAIKKIYDRDRGAEIIDALHNTPSVAVPVVLKRLKQKDEEWKRSQVNIFLFQYLSIFLSFEYREIGIKFGERSIQRISRSR